MMSPAIDDTHEKSQILTGRRKTVLLFSGGRDSTAAALRLHERGDELHLLSFRSGLSLHDGYRAVRILELETILDASRTAFRELDIRGLIREVCFVDLVEDVATDGCQLILLGEAFCMFAAAVQYSLDHSCGHVAFGATAYQSHYPEQRPETIRHLTRFLNKFGLILETPGAAWASEHEPKNILRMAGVSTKSLESTSLLSDIDDHQPVEAVVAYTERKLARIQQLLSERLTGASKW